jgi:pimeloyl-ACP methyl ester carboxylesterase
MTSPFCLIDVPDFRYEPQKDAVRDAATRWAPHGVQSGSKVAPNREAALDTAKIDAAELAYEVSGAGEPAIFIHGAFIADTFRPLLAVPGRLKGYRLILYHRRGYAGSSRASGPVSVADHAADCRALLRHLDVERAHVAGHSYGGAVALQLALESPELVNSLALLEPALIAGASADGYRESLARGAERYREMGAAVVVDEFLQARWPGYRTALDRALPGAFARAVGDAESWFDCELPGLFDWRFGEAEARGITHPVLCVLGGDSDTLSPRFGETHRLLLSWLPHAEGLVVPRATHFIQLEDPRGLAEALVAFWVRNRPPTGVNSPPDR